MKLVINGDSREVNLPESPTILSLLEAIGFGAKPVLVERNGAALFPKEFAQTPVADGDSVEIIRMVAGG